MAPQSRWTDAPHPCRRATPAVETFALHDLLRAGKPTALPHLEPRFRAPFAVIGASLYYVAEGEAAARTEEHRVSALAGVRRPGQGKDPLDPPSPIALFCPRRCRGARAVHIDVHRRSRKICAGPDDRIGECVLEAADSRAAPAVNRVGPGIAQGPLHDFYKADLVLFFLSVSLATVAGCGGSGGFANRARRKRSGRFRDVVCRSCRRRWSWSRRVPRARRATPLWTYTVHVDTLRSSGIVAASRTWAPSGGLHARDRSRHPVRRRARHGEIGGAHGARLPDQASAARTSDPPHGGGVRIGKHRLRRRLLLLHEADVAYVESASLDNLHAVLRPTRPPVIGGCYRRRHEAADR
jgi:hypothetical protein